jgi:DNA-binding NarL/FixJ family response regulator
MHERSENKNRELEMGLDELGDGDAGEATRPITVMAVDDHPLFLEGIASVLTAEPGMQLVAHARNGHEALLRYRDTRPDVTLMDIQMPDMDGIEATALILSEFPQARIVVLTTYEGDGFVLRAIRAGAFGYVVKSSLRRDLVAMVRSVHMGRRSVALTVAMDLCGLAPDDRLTARELDVLRLVADGQSNKRVGLTLSISEETVKTHMKSILPKLGANDRAHAVALAIGRGILPAPGTGRDRR